MKKAVSLLLTAIMIFAYAAPAFADTDDQTIEIGETLYYFNESTKQLEVAGDDYEWQPGDTMYIDIVGEDSQKKDVVRRYNVYAEYSFGKNLVEKITIEYRKANIERLEYVVKYTVTDAYELNGTYTYTTTGIPRKNSTEQKIYNLLTGDDNFRKAQLSYKLDVFGEFTKGVGYILNNKYYLTDSEIYAEVSASFVNSGYIKPQGTATYYFETDKDALLDAGYSPAEAGAYVYNNRYYSAAETNALLSASNISKILNGFLDSGAGLYFDNSTDILNYEGFIKLDAQGKYRYYTSLTDLNVKVPTSNGYYNRLSHDIVSSSKRDTLAREAIKAQIAEAMQSYTYDSQQANSGAGYFYFVAVKTKYSNTIKELDLVVDLTIGKTKTQAQRYSGYELNVVLKSKRGEDIEGDLITVQDEATSVSFKDFRGKVYIEFGTNGEKGFYYCDVTSQRALNLNFSADTNYVLEREYNYAQLKFLEFTAKPTFNKSGELYIFASPDDYIYQIEEKGLKEVKAKYDYDYDAWVIKTKTLGSYIISDTKLANLTFGQPTGTNNGDAPVAGNNATVTGGAEYGKPNPNTGK